MSYIEIIFDIAQFIFRYGANFLKGNFYYFLRMKNSLKNESVELNTMRPEFNQVNSTYVIRIILVTTYLLSASLS